MSTFVASVARVLQGTALAQAVGFLALPLLTRMYPPEAFGNLQLFSNAMSFVLIVVAMRYEVAILQAASTADAHALFRVCVWLTAASTLLCAMSCAVMLLLLGPWSEGATAVIWLMTPGVALAGMLQTLGYLVLRQKDFGMGANAKVVQAVTYALFALGLGWVQPESGGLIVADVAARGVAAGLILWWCTQRGFVLSLGVTPRMMVAAARTYRDMPTYAVPGGLINTAGGVLTPLMMYSTFDAATLGQYALAERGLTLPVGMLVLAVSQVFSANFAEQLRQGSAEAQRTFRRIVLTMAKIGAAPALLVAALAPWLFPLLFGAQWAGAGDMAQLLAPLVFASFVTGPVNMAIMLAGRQRTQMAWEFSRLVMMSCVWAIVVFWEFGPLPAIALHVLGGVSMSVLYLVLADRVLGTIVPPQPGA